MRKHFPPVEYAARNWLLVQNETGADIQAISSLLAQHIASPEVLIEVHRKLGISVPISDAPLYITSHIGQGEIRVADRGFSGFVVVALNGVATGWRLPAISAVNADAPTH